AHGRAGVSAIQYLRWSFKPRTRATHFNRPVVVFACQPLPLAAEPGHAIEGALAIARRGKILKTARALRNPRQHGVAVRDGLVPRNADHSAHRARGMDDDIRILRHEFNIAEIFGEVRSKKSD